MKRISTYIAALLLGTLAVQAQEENKYNESVLVKGSYKPVITQAEKVIEKIVADASSDYWLAYSFILWADIYYARGNNLQAKQTLQSIIDNYDGEDLIAVARSKYDAIVAAEQKATQPDDEEIVIEL